MFLKPRSYKGVWRYLRIDGHEHISLMPFFIVLYARWGLGANKTSIIYMKDDFKKEYVTPTVNVTKVSVEDGFRLSHESATPVTDPAGYGMTEGVTGSNENFDGSSFH